MRRPGTIVWREIEATLGREIADGTFPVGSRLPAEGDLAARFGVNRHTVRRALAELQGRGTISIERGRGMFVKAPRLAYPISKRTRYSENVLRINSLTRGQMLRSWQMPAPSKMAADLDIPAGATIVAIDDLRIIDDVPVSITTHHFPADRFHDLPMHFAETGSITASLALLGVDEYTRRLTRVFARRCAIDEAEVLKHEVGAPVLVVEAINVDSKGRPIEFGYTRSPGQQWELVIDSQLL